MQQFGLPLTVVVLIISLFICLTNAFYARIEAKSPSTWKKQSMFTTSKAWSAYSFCIIVAIAVIFFIAASDVASGFSNAGKAQDTITQQQQQMTTTDTGTDTTQSQK